MELIFENVSKNYKDKSALKAISMVLTEGVYGILGPNGAGKSTLMNILAGNLRQSTGRICLNGQDIRILGSSFRERIGYMPQQQTLYPSFSVAQFLYYVASLRDLNRKEADEKIDWALNAVALHDIRHKAIKSLSGGMKQRLLLAQAILASPDILILDEPTAGLDPKQRIEVRNLIGKISLHKIVIISTHVVSDVEYISKELILLSNGEILKRGTSQQLIKELNNQVWELSVMEDQLQDVSQYGLVCGVVKKEDEVLVRILTSSPPPVSKRCVEPTLEDVYLHHFGDVETV